MTVILMSRSEIDRMNVLRDLAEERIRVSEAVTLMGLGRRQVLRLAQGISATRPCCSGVAPTREAEQPFLSGGSADGVIGIIRECYADFGPTLAGEKLAELHGIRSRA